MSTNGASPRPEPAPGEGSPSWTPKEPNRPLRPKPGAFGVKINLPLSEIETFNPVDFNIRHVPGEGTWNTKTGEEYKPPEEPDGSPRKP